MEPNTICNSMSCLSYAWLWNRRQGRTPSSYICKLCTSCVFKVRGYSVWIVSKTFVVATEAFLVFLVLGLREQICEFFFHFIKHFTTVALCAKFGEFWRTFRGVIFGFDPAYHTLTLCCVYSPPIYNRHCGVSTAQIKVEDSHDNYLLAHNSFQRM